MSFRTFQQFNESPSVTTRHTPITRYMDYLCYLPMNLIINK
nr:MAG TPA: hypothetical protein [Caudoviricetes sp.]